VKPIPGLVYFVSGCIIGLFVVKKLLGQWIRTQERSKKYPAQKKAKKISVLKS
jgi:hypothetical protein